ncbi:tRNA lysidine(34) synthetase TilS [Megasphaera sueciensis]|jgi:tRNA(Ile)-lysidine synthase|uniref:tRNA lysidine(34) synthetase TilS n=1 Tax=Megasphaera sueciensis TaxID=349094 RepID=UPI003D094AAC
MLEIVEAFCLKHNLFAPGDTLVVACSGGPDSLALLDVLARLKDAYALKLVVCYVHHGIRKAADREVGFVRRAAQDRDCLFVTARVDVPALAAARHESEETTGRIERYRILRRTAAEHHAAGIAVAHHQNDQAETVLQHLLRGSGLTGLTGMRPKSGDIIRPFLAVTRNDIETYIAGRGLVPCDDETNHWDIYMRNRIRRRLLPELMQYNPNIVSDLNRLADIAQGEDAYMEKETETAYAAWVCQDTPGCHIAKKKLTSLPVALQRRLVRKMFQQISGQAGNIPFHYTEQLRMMASQYTGRQFRCRTIWAYTTYDNLHMIPAGTAIPVIPDVRRQDDTIVPLDGPGTYRLGPYTVTVTLSRKRPQEKDLRVCVLDYNRHSAFYVLRYRRPGDKIRLGPHNGKTLKKYFIDKKIPLSQRDSIPLIAHNENIFWIFGQAAAFEASVQTETTFYMIGTITGGDLHA